MEKSKVKESLSILIKLQEIDSQLAELEVTKVFYPTLLEQLHGEVDQLEQSLQENTEKVMNLKKDNGLKELELKETREKLEKSQQRLMVVQSNKEYDAVQNEIRASEEKIAQFEEELIMLIGDLESTEALVVELTEKLEAARKNNEAQIKEIESKYSSIEGKAARIMGKHNELASKVDKRLFSTYNRIRKGKQGHAVVKVKNRACGGCFQALPPRLIQEIRKQTSIIVCEACGRILVWDDEVSP